MVFYKSKLFVLQIEFTLNFIYFSLMKKQINILLICIVLLYLEKDTACRGLCDIVNQPFDFYNLLQFIKHYLLIGLVLWAIKFQSRLSILPLIVGLLLLVKSVYYFLCWIFFTSTFEQVFNSGSLRLVFQLTILGIAYVSSLLYFLKHLKKSA